METDNSHDAKNGESYEEEHVHKVYQEIAPHFSSTRYKVCVDNPVASSLLLFP